MAMLTRLAVLAGSVLLATEGRLLKHENYNSAYVSYPSHIYTPSSVWEIWHIVRRAKWQGKRVRVVGSHVHSWGGLSMSDEGQVVIDTEKFNDILDLDTAKKQVRVQSGLQINALAGKLYEHGLTFLGQGAIDLQSVGGAIATATHGSNSASSTTFSDQVVAVKLMDGNGRTHVIDQDHPHFRAVKTHLGVLGVVLEVTLQLRDQYYVQEAPAGVPLSEMTLEKVRTELQTSNHSVMYFPFIYTAEEKVVVRRNELSTPAEDTPHPKDSEGGDSWVAQFQQDTMKKMVQNITAIPELLEGFFSGMTSWPPPVKVSYDALAVQTYQGRELMTSWLDTEYAFPLEKFDEVWADLRALLLPVRDIGFFLNFRFQATSDALLAMNAGTDGMVAYLDISYLNKVEDHYIRSQVEALMISYGARPHWGKLNMLKQADVIALYGQESFDKFKAAKACFDQMNLFGNAYTDAAFGLTPPQQS